VIAIPAIERRLIDVPGDVLPRPHADCYWLIEGRLLAGEHPGSALPAAAVARIDAILDAGVRRFIDLTGERECPAPYVPTLQERAGERNLLVGHQRFAIPDFGVPSGASMREVLDALYTAVGSRERVYLHCWGGVGRTGTVVGCLLREQGYTATEALAAIARKWQSMEKRARHPVSPETRAQIEFIERWSGAAANGRA